MPKAHCTSMNKFEQSNATLAFTIRGNLKNTGIVRALVRMEYSTLFQIKVLHFVQRKDVLIFNSVCFRLTPIFLNNSDF